MGRGGVIKMLHRDFHEEKKLNLLSVWLQLWPFNVLKLVIVTSLFYYKFFMGNSYADHNDEVREFKGLLGKGLFKPSKNETES